VLQVAGPAQAFPPESRGEVIPWLDQPAPVPPPVTDIIGRQLIWEELDSWRTPNDEFFTVKHYNQPDLDETEWRLDISGLVSRPQSLTLADLKQRRRREVDFTMECSGNTGPPFFIGGVGNARWAGTPLAPLLERAGVLEQGIEVVFWGADAGPTTIRDNSGVVSPGDTGVGEPDAGGGLDLTVTEQFARSMSLDEAMSPHNLLCYEMNGEPLPPEHGFPVRLIAPGWYGVANVKWLTRVEVRDQRYAGRFMARDYVTIREEVREGQTVWTFSTVRHDGSSPRRPRSSAAATGTRSWEPPGEPRSPASRSRSTADPGWRPRSRGARMGGAVPSSPGRFGRGTGGRPPPASTGSGPAPSTSTEMSSPRLTSPTSPAGEPTGRTTGRSNVGCSSRELARPGSRCQPIPSPPPSSTANAHPREVALKLG
jgi:DMSO/TMAO reductase YedYZ molybdopterin-dependent catalytic subunit